jgi:hypothetical protein
MTHAQKTRFLGEAGLAGICAALALLTTVWPDWIEGLLGVSPDNHSGMAEWSIVLGLGMVAVVFGALARFEWRRSLRHS